MGDFSDGVMLNSTVAVGQLVSWSDLSPTRQSPLTKSLWRSSLLERECMCLCVTFVRIAWSAVWLPIWYDLLRVIILCDLLCDVCLPYLYAAFYFLNCIVTFVCMLRMLHGVVWRSWNMSITSVEGLSWLVSWMYWCFLSKEMKEKIKYQFFYKKDHIQTN